MQSKKYQYWSSQYPTHLKGLYLYHHLSSLAQPKVHQSLLGRNLCRLWHNQHKPWMVWCCLYHNRSFCNQHWSSKEHWRIAKYQEGFHLNYKVLSLNFGTTFCINTWNQPLLPQILLLILDESNNLVKDISKNTHLTLGCPNRSQLPLICCFRVQRLLLANKQVGH